MFARGADGGEPGRDRRRARHAAGVTAQRIPSSSPYADRIGFSAAVRAGDLVLSAGTTAIDPAGACVGEGDPHAQTREALRKVLAAFAAAGALPEDVVQTRMSLVDPGHAEAVGRAHAEVFAAVRPAATMVVVAALLDPRMLVEVEAVAWASGGR